MTDRELMQQALEALDSDSPDVQLRAAIALRQALERERNQTWTQSYWTDYERGLVAAEREACAKIVEEYCAVMRLPLPYEVRSDITKLAAQAIRARGEK